MCGRFVLISVPIISPHCPQTTLTPPSFYCATVRHKYKNTLYYPYHPHSSYQCITSLLTHKGIIMKRRNRHYKFPLFHIAKFFLNSPILVPIANICHGCRDQRWCTFFKPVYFFARRTQNVGPSILALFWLIWAIFSANLRTFLVYFLQA